MDKVHQDKNSGDKNEIIPTVPDRELADQVGNRDREVILEVDLMDKVHQEDEEDDDEEEELQIAVYRLPESHKVRIVKVVPLPHARSEIWSYFGFIADDTGEIQDRKKVMCKVCATTLSYSGNTTNLFTHLKSMHPEANPQKMPPTNKSPWKGKRVRKGILMDPSNVSRGNGSRIVLTDRLSRDDKGLETELNEASPNNSRISVITSKSTNLKSPMTLPTPEITSHQHSNTCTSDDITNALVNVIVQDFRPVSLVEGRGFQALLKLIVPSYQIPDTKELSHLAQRKFETMKSDIGNNRLL